MNDQQSLIITKVKPQRFDYELNEFRICKVKNNYGSGTCRLLCNKAD